MIGPGNQFRTRDCSALAVFLSDLQVSDRIDRIQELERKEGSSHPDYVATLPLRTGFSLGEGHAAVLLKQLTMEVASRIQEKPMPDIEPVLAWSYKNTAMLVQTFLLASSSHGIATAAMEGIDPRRAKEILCVPDRYAIPMVVAAGYPYDLSESDKPMSPRLKMDEFVFRETFGRPLDAGRIQSIEEDTQSA